MRQDNNRVLAYYGREGEDGTDWELTWVIKATSKEEALQYARIFLERDRGNGIPGHAFYNRMSLGQFRLNNHKHFTYKQWHKTLKGYYVTQSGGLDI